MTYSNPVGAAKEAANSYTKALLAVLGDADPLTVQNELVPALEKLVHGLSEVDARRPEAPGKWSVLQVLQHLVDTETVYSFRVRMILAHDSPDLQGYDQDRWAERLRYHDATVAESLAEIRTLRKRNLRLFHALTPAELDRVGLHSERGPESVRHIMRMIAAHDLVHRRQVERIVKGLRT